MRARTREAVSRIAMADAKQGWPADHVERWPIDRLIPFAKNARNHTPPRRIRGFEDMTVRPVGQVLGSGKPAFFCAPENGLDLSPDRWTTRNPADPGRLARRGLDQQAAGTG